MTSANCVGYANQTGITKDKFYIFGSGFDSIGTGKRINDVIGAVTPDHYTKDKAFLNTATQIQVPLAVGTGYTTYYYLDNAYIKKTGAEVYGWADGSGNFVDVNLTPGVAFWFKNKIDADGSVFTQQGQVPEDNGAGVRIECPAAFALRNNPFPMAFKLNGPNVDNSEVPAVAYEKTKTFLTTAVQIQVPLATGDGYTTYYYLSNAYIKKTGAEVYGWADGSGNYVDVEIPAGQGFWTKGGAQGELAITFKLNAPAAE